MNDGSGQRDTGVPSRVLEGIARTIHDDYVRARLAEGRRLGSEPALRPWDELPEHLKDANRDQARGYATHLAAIGYKIAPAGEAAPAAQTEFVLRGEQLERMAQAEHERWIAHKRSQGYSYGAKRVEDGPGRRHPGILPWEELSEDVRDLDRQPLRRMLGTLGAANLRIVPFPS
jgi:RyR domain